MFNFSYYFLLTDIIGALSPLGGDISGQKTGEPGVKNHCKGCKGVLFPLLSGGDPLCCDPHSLGFIFLVFPFFISFCSVYFLITTERGIGVFVCVPHLYYLFLL